MAMRAIAIAMLMGGVAAAHPLDMGSLRVASVGETVTIELDLDVGLATKLSPALDVKQLADVTYRRAALATNAGACAWQPAGATLVTSGATVTQVATATCPAGSSALHWELPFLATQQATFELIGKVKGFAGEHVVLLDPNTTTISVTGAPVEDPRGIAVLVWIGIATVLAMLLGGLLWYLRSRDSRSRVGDPAPPGEQRLRSAPAPAA